MQRLEERNEGRRLGGRQVLPVRWHIPVALDPLSDQLILGQPRRHLIERRPTLTSALAERVTVTTLLGLKDQSAPPFECSAADQVRSWDRCAAPRVHHR